MAAKISRGSVAKDSPNAAAAPWKSPCSPAGVSTVASAFLIAATACPSATPDARLKDSVTAGNWPAWAMDSAVRDGS